MVLVQAPLKTSPLSNTLYMPVAMQVQKKFYLHKFVLANMRFAVHLFSYTMWIYHRRDVRYNGKK